MKYAGQLAKYINLDIYGKCSGMVGNKNVSLKNCDISLGCLNQYKFYLAFENSNCVDYITEKFFEKALRSGWPLMQHLSVFNIMHNNQAQHPSHRDGAAS